MQTTPAARQVNIRVGSAFYRALEALARQERRSVPQTARLLLEEGLQQRSAGRPHEDDAPAARIAEVAMAGGAFGWLEEEPELYDDTCGEPL